MTALPQQRGPAAKGALPDRVRGVDIRPLTGIRGIAALWVVLLHLSIFTPYLDLRPRPAWREAVNLGYLAVDLFFVLSGFVLAMTSMRRVSSDVGREFWPFMLARVFRLFPLHLTILGAFTVFVVWIGDFGLPSYQAQDLLLTAFLLQIWHSGPLSGWNVPSWSIAAEMVAYLFFPAIALVAANLRRSSQALATITVALAILVVTLLAGGSHSLDHIQRLGPVRCLGEFTAGVMTWRWIDLRPGGGVPGDALLLAGLLTFGAVMLVPDAQLVIPFACCALVAACYLPGRLAPLLFGNRIVHFLGAISFSVYLDHFLIFTAADKAARAMDLASGALPVRLGWVAAQLVLVLLVATLTWRFVEKPSQDVGRRVRRWLERRGTAPAAAAPLPDLAGTGVR